MKYLRLTMIVAFVLMAIGAMPAEAQAQGYKFSYKSTINIQNLANEPTTVEFSYFYGSGSATPGDIASTASIVLAANEFRAISTLPTDPGFNGSVVIASDNPVAVVSNLHGSNMIANASYIGSEAGSTTVNIPLLMKDNYGYDTWFTVQNASESNATVTVNYSDGTTNSASVKGGASATFNQALESHPVKVFAATVTSTVPLVVAVVEESSNVLFAYSGFNSASTNPVMPLINTNNWGYTSSINLMNIGSQSTSVTISYTPTTGTACTETQTVPAGQSRTFVSNAFQSTGTTVTSNCVKGKTFVGSAAVTANSNSQNLVAVVNQHRLPVNGEAYNGFNTALATPKLVLPLLMDRNYGWFTSANIMNVGGSAVDIFCDLTGTSVNIDVKNVQPGQMINKEQLNAIGNRWTGSASCFAYQPGTTNIAADGKIVGVVNQLLSGAEDTFMVYEGVNVSVP